jgi:hypothetical protein
MTLRYSGYQRPTDAFQLIVKALPVIEVRPRANPNALTVNFVDFQTNGFVLRITDAQGIPLEEQLLAEVELMVEVSRFTKVA